MAKADSEVAGFDPRLIDSRSPAPSEAPVDPEIYDLVDLQSTDWSELNVFISECQAREYNPAPARAPAPEERRIVVSDIHGNYRDLYRVLLGSGAINRDGSRNPGYWVCQIGDLIHGGHEVFTEDAQASLLGPEWVDCQLVGNHDLGFLTNEIDSYFTGKHDSSELAPGINRMLQANLRNGHYRAAIGVDGHLISHAGLDLRLAENNSELKLNDPAELGDQLDQMFHDRLSRAIGPEPALDWIGEHRGGLKPTGSIFWCSWPELMQSYRESPKLAEQLAQVVGHTPWAAEPIKQSNCWLTDTIGKEGAGGKIAALVKNRLDSDWQPLVIERSPRSG